jgi:hypothetical protein
MQSTVHARTTFAPRKDHRGVDLISEVLPFGGLWYSGPRKPGLKPATAA